VGLEELCVSSMSYRPRSCVEQSQIQKTS